jgi:hypothetical protein
MQTAAIDLLTANPPQQKKAERCQGIIPVVVIRLPVKGKFAIAKPLDLASPKPIGALMLPVANLPVRPLPSFLSADLL